VENEAYSRVRMFLSMETSPQKSRLAINGTGNELNRYLPS
jgi:hypothetical protein